MSGIEALRAYAAALREKCAIEQQIERLHIPMRPAGLHGIEYGTTRGTNDPTSAALQLMDGLCQRLQEQTVRLAAIAERGEAVLQTIPSLTDRTIMRSYYVLDMSDEDIADDMRRSRSWVQQRRHEVERHLQKVV